MLGAESTVIIPKAGDPRPYKRLYERWREDHDAVQPDFRIENIRFEHDPHWRDRVFSIQNAHDMKSPVWKVVYWLMITANAGWAFVRWR